MIEKSVSRRTVRIFIRETFCGKIPLFITYQMSYYYQVFSVSLSPLFLFPVILIIKLKKKRKFRWVKDNYRKAREDAAYVSKFIKETECFRTNPRVNFDGINIHFRGSWVETLIDWFARLRFGTVVAQSVMTFLENVQYSQHAPVDFISKYSFIQITRRK